MGSKVMSRVLVTDGKAIKPQKMFEVILTPEQSERINYHVVVTALRMLFPLTSKIHIEAYGV